MLIVISAPNFIPKEADIINSLFQNGLKRLHLRKPDCDVEDLRKLITEIDSAFYDKISLHQHHSLAKGFDIDRLHFTENNRLVTSPETLQKLKGDGFILSTSIHESVQLNTISHLFDYTFFGPVFNSISKKGYNGILEKDFRLDHTLKKMKVIALGGIDITNLVKVREMNFDGAAVLGTLWKEPVNAVEVFRKLAAIEIGIQPFQGCED